MSEPSLFIATPIHSGQVHYAYMAGCLSAARDFAGRYAVEVYKSSFLPRSRDILTAAFLRSGATHMLWVDSDIGWNAKQAQTLLDTGRDFVSGVYAKKQPDCLPPIHLLDPTVTERGLLEASSVPGGFLLLSRACVERMVGAYHDHDYNTEHGKAWALWAMEFVPGKSYGSEDVAFCHRWRAIGGRIWVHPEVVVSHYGEREFLPKTKLGAPETRPLQAVAGWPGGPR